MCVFGSHSKFIPFIELIKRHVCVCGKGAKSGLILSLSFCGRVMFFVVKEEEEEL